MFRLSVVLLLVLTLGCVAPDPTTSSAITGPITKDADPGTAASTGERLLATPPEAWQQIYQLNNDNIRLTDYVPSDESAEEWKTKLSFEAHAQLAGTDPISIVMGEVKRKKEICSHVDDSNLFSGYENNYPTSVRFIQCGEHANLKQGEISLIKVIQGADYSYIVKFQKKVPVFEEGKAEFTGSEVATWSSYLKQISLCDTRDTNHKCPSDHQAEP
jgi:hypothetical protein